MSDREASKRIQRKRTVYLSECGEYLCRATRCWGNFEAWTRDGSIHWRDDSRIRTWADQRRFRHPMVYAVGGYSAEKTGQKKDSFTLNLLHCDTAKIVEPFTGNTIIDARDIVFRRKLPPQNVPRWIQDADVLLEIANV